MIIGNYLGMIRTVSRYARKACGKGFFRTDVVFLKGKS